MRRRDIGEMHRRRDGGKKAQGNRHRERKRGEQTREERKKKEGEGGGEWAAGLHFFKRAVIYKFSWSEFFASNSSFGSHWAQRTTALNKVEILFLYNFYSQLRNF